ncbi:MAG: hypothetical protein EBZ51_08415 [Synechococcaceae bacterium WB9_2_112]|nr:hypothetical protein [Synechococcaceae bacterium WB9_2_112]
MPPFAPKQKQYPLLLGLARRLLVDLGKQGAIDILRETCAAQITDLESYFVTPSSGISPGSTWAYLRDQWGIDIRRHDLRGKHPGGAQQGRQAPPASEEDEDQPAADQPRPRAARAPLLTLDEVRERLRYAVQSGASRQDLEAERIRLAAASDIPAATLQGLLLAIQREAESGLQVQQEAQRLARAKDRADANKAISLDELLPPAPVTCLPTTWPSAWRFWSASLAW